MAMAAWYDERREAQARAYDRAGAPVPAALRAAVRAGGRVLDVGDVAVAGGRPAGVVFFFRSPGRWSTSGFRGAGGVRLRGGAVSAVGAGGLFPGARSMAGWPRNSARGCGARGDAAAGNGARDGGIHGDVCADVAAARSGAGWRRASMRCWWWGLGEWGPSWLLPRVRAGAAATIRSWRPSCAGRGARRGWRSKAWRGGISSTRKARRRAPDGDGPPPPRGVFGAAWREPGPPRAGVPGGAADGVAAARRRIAPAGAAGGAGRRRVFRRGADADWAARARGLSGAARRKRFRSGSWRFSRWRRWRAWSPMRACRRMELRADRFALRDAGGAEVLRSSCGANSSASRSPWRRLGGRWCCCGGCPRPPGAWRRRARWPRKPRSRPRRRSAQRRKLRLAVGPRGC
jgi:hypothetical protein